jgi:hypothetical protein
LPSNLKAKRPQGFALILVLIFLEVFALLSIAVLQNNILAARMTRNEWIKNNLMYGASQQLAIIANQPVGLCLIKTMPTQWLIQQPLSVWQNASCAGNFHSFKYYYVVETLGNDNCTHIKDTAVNTIATYYRITLLMIDVNYPGIKTIFQSTQVTPGSTSGVCQGTIRIIANGLQTLHKLV